MHIAQQTDIWPMHRHNISQLQVKASTAQALVDRSTKSKTQSCGSGSLLLVAYCSICMHDMGQNGAAQAPIKLLACGSEALAWGTKGR